MKHNSKTVYKVYVFRRLHGPLLGIPAIEALGLVQRVSSVSDDITQLFPKLFQGLGKLEGNYKMKLCEDAGPFSLTPRRVEILLPKVKAELERMQALGVISRIEEPTDWCAGMVVIPKQSGEVRICVDLTL